MWPILNLPPCERGEWHVPSRHVAEAYAFAASVPAVRSVFEAAGVQHWGIKVGPASAFTGPLRPGEPGVSHDCPVSLPRIRLEKRPYYGSPHDGAPSIISQQPGAGHDQGSGDAERRRQRTRSPRCGGAAEAREAAIGGESAVKQDEGEQWNEGAADSAVRFEEVERGVCDDADAWRLGQQAACGPRSTKPGSWPEFARRLSATSEPCLAFRNFDAFST